VRHQAHPPHGWTRNPDGTRLEIVAANGSFHGRTLGALAVTGNPAKRVPFAPLPEPVSFVDYGDVRALEDAVSQRTAAVFVEPALGEGGIVRRRPVISPPRATSAMRLEPSS
jgi:acetylornithine aminotransferase